MTIVLSGHHRCARDEAVLREVGVAEVSMVTVLFMRMASLLDDSMPRDRRHLLA
jgi:hypothetical protein